MPIVPYYLGRPATIWIAIVPRRRPLSQRYPWAPGSSVSSSSSLS